MLTSLTALAAPKALDLSAYKGKVVMIDFWASWCGPCRQSFPWLNEMRTKKSSDDFVIIGINVDENTEDAKKFLAKVPADFDIIYDPEGDYVKFWLPELEKVPKSKIHQPDMLSIKEQKAAQLIIGTDYPQAIVSTARWIN